MKLTELDPRWLYKDGRRVGFTFRSPTKPEWRQSCFVESFGTKEQWEIFGEPDMEFTQGCRKECCWKIEGGIEHANFSTLTVTPSIDGSAGGTWHGFITNGEIK